MTAPGVALDELRPAAFAVAYRMLGSVAEAEDVVQEALIRVDRAVRAGERLASPRAYVATVTTRLAIDALRSARARRERYVGAWLPEPIVGTAPPADDPARQAEIADSLSMAFLSLLERLSPEQRAALLLHDVFDYGYGEVARIVGTSEANARQLTARARRHVTRERPRFTTTAEHRSELAKRFLAAARDGDLAGLESLLAADVELQGDGGGKAPALAHTVRGRGRVAQTLMAWMRQAGRFPGVTMEPAEVNGQPGLVNRDPEGRIFGVLALEVAGDGIRGIRSVVNPDKLRHLGDVGDLGGLLRRARDGA